MAPEKKAAESVKKAAESARSDSAGPEKDAPAKDARGKDAPAKDGKVDKQLEHQLDVVKELSRDPADVHPGEAPSAPLTEHGEKSGLKPLVDDLHDRRAKIKLGGGEEKIDAQHAKG